MPALVAGIHVLNPFKIKDFEIKDVDGRDKPGHDGGGSISRVDVLPGWPGFHRSASYDVAICGAGRGSGSIAVALLTYRHVSAGHDAGETVCCRHHGLSNAWGWNIILGVVKAA
jgi:hypothetical protein